MKELKEKAQALIDNYTTELSSKGLQILLSKRNFESNVSERSSGYYATGMILNPIDFRISSRFASSRKISFL